MTDIPETSATPAGAAPNKSFTPYPANLTTALQDLHIQDVRFRLATDFAKILLTDIYPEDVNPSFVSGTACSLAAALVADAERLGWLAPLPEDTSVPHPAVAENIERSVHAQAFAHFVQSRVQADVQSKTIASVPPGMRMPGH